MEVLILAFSLGAYALGLFRALNDEPPHASSAPQADTVGSDGKVYVDMSNVIDADFKSLDK